MQLYDILNTVRNFHLKKFKINYINNSILILQYFNFPVVNLSVLHNSNDIKKISQPQPSLPEPIKPVIRTTSLRR